MNPAVMQMQAYDSSRGELAGSHRDRSLWHQDSLQAAVLRVLWTGSGGVMRQAPADWSYSSYIGTSPWIVDVRFLSSVAPVTSSIQVTNEVAPSALRAVLALSIADQAREALASMSLNKTQLAEVLGVSRPTLYDWLDGKEPNASNTQRLTTLLRLLSNAGVTSANPLSPRFLRQPLSEGGTPLLEALKAESIDEQLVSSLVREAQSLGSEAENRRKRREDRLRALGFEELSDEERREQLARNIAMLDWPKS
jgi:transcriptional regulator with XRE-family HTH domain